MPEATRRNAFDRSRTNATFNCHWLSMLPEKRLFKYSVLYLFILFGVLVVDRWVLA